MKTRTDFTPSTPQPQPLAQQVLALPHTKMGRRSVALAAIFLILIIINVTVFMPTVERTPWWEIVLPFYSIGMLLCGLAAGILGVIAVIKLHERSLFVWLAMLIGLFVLFLVLGEFTVPH